MIKIWILHAADTSLVNLLQSSSHLDSKDILTLVSDMLLAGVDTTSYSMSFLLHLIAKHKDVQDKLRDHVFNGNKICRKRMTRDQSYKDNF